MSNWGSTSFNAPEAKTLMSAACATVAPKVMPNAHSAAARTKPRAAILELLMESSRIVLRNSRGETADDRRWRRIRQWKITRHLALSHHGSCGGAEVRTM